MRRSAICALTCLLAPACQGFYLPGVAPRDYLPGEKVELHVNKLTSTKTQCVRAAAWRRLAGARSIASPCGSGSSSSLLLSHAP